MPVNDNFSFSRAFYNLLPFIFAKQNRTKIQETISLPQESPYMGMAKRLPIRWMITE
jgi:hypothetical protein